MPHSRHKDQTVEAFSAPKSLLTEARVRAAQLKMTKSGYFRYCLAKELGYPEAEAKVFAQHNQVTALQDLMGQGSNLNPKVKEAVDAVVTLAVQKVRKRRTN